MSEKPLSFIAMVRDELRKVIEDETDRGAGEFFKCVGKMTGANNPAVPKPVIEGECGKAEGEK